MLIENIPVIIAEELNIKPEQVTATENLLNEGNTVPFIARYRKEVTGSLDEGAIRTIEERLAYLKNFVARQQEILEKIEELGKLTPELKTAIEKAAKLQELEDLYLPYRPKKRTRASVAKEKGLEPLAEKILAQEETSGKPEDFAKDFVDAEKGVETIEDALAGAADIIAETVAEDAALRGRLREHLQKTADINAELNEENKTSDEAQVFLMYENYSEPLRTLPGHRILAINRGEKKGFLKVRLECNHEDNCERIFRRICKKPSIFSDIIKAAAEDGYKRLLFPALEREIRANLTETAETGAIKIFGQNLKQLLLAAPLAGHNVLGLDPGYRTGCKMAAVDKNGKVTDHGVLYVTHSEEQKKAAAAKVLSLIKKHDITLISIGNGTASLETEEFAAAVIRDNNLTNVHYIITNEAGASVYSASKLAKEELPEYDVTIRGAVSIARRVQDPLAELVKIDPKAIGVGQYQHDVNQKELAATLDATVESAVNHVGVDLNTASAALLKYVAGITSSVAQNIVKYRGENGAFKNRRELLKVPRLGPTAFTQCAGFLRIREGDNPLDNTAVHPESYELAEKILAELNFAAKDFADKDKIAAFGQKLKQVDEKTLAEKLNAGLPTVHDILDALAKPGRDPREDLPKPLTRQAIVKLSDITVGTLMKGTVRNITDFGVFVDIGIKTAGLIHISELSRRRVKHPLDVVSVGDILTVMVISVDEKRNRIGLSLKQVPEGQSL